MTVRIRLLGALCATIALGVIACGDDGEKGDVNAPGDGDQGGADGQGGGSDGSGSDGEDADGSADGDDAPAPPLADDTAGKECANDGACGPMGRCASELTGGSAIERLGAPPTATPGGYCTAECSDSSDCGAGGVCFGVFGGFGGAGECRAACTSNGDCRDGYECAMLNAQVGFPLPSSCQPLPTPDQLGADQAGKSCGADADCGEGRCAGADEGQGTCTGLCLEDAHCGAGGICVPGLYGSAGSCAEACQTDADCQNAALGYACQGDGERKACGRQLAPGVVGNSCTEETETTDCPGGSCRLEARGVPYPGGYCVGACESDAQCGQAGVCINSSTCLKGCSGPADCREGYECKVHPLAMMATDVTVCYPAAQAAPDAGT